MKLLWSLVLISAAFSAQAFRIKLEHGVPDCTVARFTGGPLDSDEVELDYHFFVEGKHHSLNYDYLKAVDVTVYRQPLIPVPNSPAENAADPAGAGFNTNKVEVRKDLKIFQEEYKRFKVRGTGDYYLCFEHRSPAYKEVTVNLVYFYARPAVALDVAGGAEPRPPTIGTPILRNPKGTEVQRKLEVATEEDVSQVKSLANRVKSWLDEIRYEQVYWKRRIERHMATQTSSYARTLFFSLGETSAVVAVGLLQVLFFHRLFSTNAMLRRGPRAPSGPPVAGLLGSFSTFASSQPQGLPYAHKGGRIIV